MKIRNILSFCILTTFCCIMLSGCVLKKPTQQPPSFFVEDKTSSTITLTLIEGAEYSKDGGHMWQTSNRFEGLKPDTVYKTTVRMRETEAYAASPAAEVVEVATERVTVTDFSVTQSPVAVLNAGEPIRCEGGTMTLFYSDSTSQEVDIQPAWTTADLFKSNITVKYDTIEKTLQMPPVDAVTVQTDAQLADALTSKTWQTVLIKNGVYNLQASAATTYVQNPKFVIGEGDVKIYVSGEVSLQAALVFKSNVTLADISVYAEGSKAAVKISTLSNDSFIGKAFLKNVNILGASGLNFHKVNTAVLENVNVSVAASRACVALSVAESRVKLFGCDIAHGAWGSIGVMHAEGYLPVSTLDIDEQTAVSSYVYVEHFATLGDIITGLQREMAIMGTTLVYLPTEE